jgi:hypothetical protein
VVHERLDRAAVSTATPAPPMSTVHFELAWSAGARLDPGSVTRDLRRARMFFHQFVDVTARRTTTGVKQRALAKEFSTPSPA